MKNRILYILLLFSFSAVVLQPVAPFVQYFLFNANHTVLVQDNNCCCEQDNSKTAAELMNNNGSNYLSALIKRTCDDQQKRKPAVPVVQFVFVKNLIADIQKPFVCPEDNYTQISTFIIQPAIQSYIMDIFHPPASLV